LVKDELRGRHSRGFPVLTPGEVAFVEEFIGDPLIHHNVYIELKQHRLPFMNKALLLGEIGGRKERAQVRSGELTVESSQHHEVALPLPEINEPVVFPDFLLALPNPVIFGRKLQGFQQLGTRLLGWSARSVAQEKKELIIREIPYGRQTKSEQEELGL